NRCVEGPGGIVSDIFLSYATEDLQRVKPLVTALEQCGWSVWWDRHIPIGSWFDQVLEGAIASAQCAIVVWSEASVGSEWVRNEDTEADRRNILVPTLIDPIDIVRIPFPFRGIQAAKLIGWDGRLETPDFPQLKAAVETLLKKEANVAPLSRPVGPLAV